MANRTYEDEDGNEVVVKVKQHWEICPNCDGEGRHMTNSLRNHAFTPEEFAEEFDYEEQEAYFGGGYDVPCEECNGTGKVQVDDMDELKTRDPKAAEAIEKREELDARFEAENRAERRAECAAECAIIGNYTDFYDGNY